MTDPIPADLARAADAVDVADAVVAGAVRRLARTADIEAEQVLAYDLAHAAAGVRTARATLAYGALGPDEARISCAFVADVLADLTTRTVGREDAWDAPRDWLEPAADFVRDYRDPAFLAGLCGVQGDRHLDADFALVRDTFHRFAEEQLRPRAEHIHRSNSDIPEEIIGGLAEMGAFGLSIPEEYGGFASGGESDYLGMVVATEELSWGSLGAGGSLITRPEILSRALVAGGTETQKQQWLPRLASGEVMNAVAVTEPDFGSDVAGIVTSATPTAGGWLINGTKTWCTFAARADVLMLLARTDPDRTKTHRGLSLFIVAETAGRRARLPVHPGRGRRGAVRPARPHGGSTHRHDRLPGHALLRDRLRELVRPGREPGRRPTAAWAGLLPPDGRLRERPAPDRGTGPRGDAGRLRGGLRLRAGRVVFGHPILDYQLTRAKLGPDGRPHPGRPASSPTRWPG